MRSTGTLLCVGSAAGFGAMAVFGKLAYDNGATVGTLLAVRFALAAALFWALVLADGSAREIRSLGRRDIVLALALGACGYAAQAGCFFAALDRIDASLLSLMLYTFPGMVAVVAIVLGRERADSRRLGALGLASGGLVLVLASAKAGSLDPVGTALALTAAVIYTTYILVSEGIAGRIRPSLLSALVCTGAAVSLTVGLRGARRPAPGRRHRRRLGLARRYRGGLDRRRGEPLLRRPEARGPDHRLDPLDGRAGCHGGARVPCLRRATRNGPASRRRSRDRGRAGARELPSTRGDWGSGGMSGPLEGKVALVSGATRGGGRGIAVALGEAGATVYATGRSTREQRSEIDRPETIEETAELVTEAGGEGIAVAVDHLDPAQVASLVERIDSEQGRLDVLVNDIWGSEHLFEWKSTLWEHDLDNGLRLLRLAIDTHLITSHHALPLLVRRPGGLVVEVTDGTAAYNADHYRVGMFYDLAKTSVTRMAWGLAKELEPHEGTAVALTPGWMRSELMLEHHSVSESNWRDATERTPHFCISESPRFVGRAVAALAGDPDRSRWNGQSLSSGELAQVYGFTDVDGTQPDCWRYMVEVVEREGATAGDDGYR